MAVLGSKKKKAFGFGLYAEILRLHGSQPPPPLPAKSNKHGIMSWLPSLILLFGFSVVVQKSRGLGSPHNACWEAKQGPRVIENFPATFNRLLSGERTNMAYVLSQVSSPFFHLFAGLRSE